MLGRINVLKKPKVFSFGSMLLARALVLTFEGNVMKRLYVCGSFKLARARSRLAHAGSIESNDVRIELDSMAWNAKNPRLIFIP